MNLSFFQSLKIKLAISRINKMESLFDKTQNLFLENKTIFLQNKENRKNIKTLFNYYKSGKWLNDFTLDEQHLLPKNLKRGILAQDCLHNFFSEIKSYAEKL